MKDCFFKFSVFRSWSCDLMLYNTISTGDDGAQREMQKIYMASLCFAVMQPLLILHALMAHSFS